MPGCILNSPEGEEQRARIVAAAEAIGSKVMPMISQFCEFHSQHHAVAMKGASVENNYGAPAVNLTQEEEKEQGHYHHNEFCSACSSYHKIGACRGPRTRESVGT